MKIFSFLAICFFCIASYSQEPRNSKDGKKSQISKENLVKKNIEVSEQVDSLAKRIDLFLTGEKVSAGDNETTIVLSNRLDWTEGGELAYKPHFDIDLRLPNLEKKTKLKFSSYDSSEVGSGVRKSRVDSQSAEENYGTSIEFAEKLSDIDVRFRPRLQLSPVLGMSYLLRFRQEFKVTESEIFNPTFSLFVRPEDGAGVFLSLNKTYLLKESRVLKWINEGEYTNENNIFSTNNGLTFSNTLPWKHTHMVHALLFESTNRPKFHLARVVVSSGFYHKAMYRVFHYAITPFVAFDKEDNFKGKFGIRFDANFIF